jgi:maleylacetoacetate isomerase
VRIALNLAGIAYQPVVIDLLAGDHVSPEHLRAQSAGQGPRARH